MRIDAEYTPEQLTEAIAAAIRDRDFPVIPYLVTLLAVKDPEAAQQVLDTIEVGLETGRARDA